MKNFNFLEPKNLPEAVDLLSQFGDRAKILAGGTDLLVQMKKGKVRPENLINLKKVSGLNQVEYTPAGLKVGSLVSIGRLAQEAIIREKYPVLAQAAAVLGSPQVRSRATVGGNLSNASPAADTAPALLVYQAQVRVAGAAGERLIALEDFFQAPGKTSLQSGEILTGVEIPAPLPGTGAVYIKHGRRKGHEIAMVGVCALINLEPGTGKIAQARIALGAVAPTPLRAKAAEEILAGQLPDPTLLEKAANLATDAATPISDVRGSAEYRKLLVQVLTLRALQQAVSIAAK